MSTPTRNTRQDLIGIVTSRSGNKSIKVTVPFKVPHPRYQKVINRKTVVHVHDEKNEAGLGDKVEIMETRPVSRLKRWRLVGIIQKAVTASAAITETDVAATVPTKTSKAIETAETAEAAEATATAETTETKA
jgi:small subunit ribosomal protein S17